MLWMIVVIWCFSCMTALAASLPCAAIQPDMKELQRYPSFSLDEKSGLWQVRANGADALMDRFWDMGTDGGQAYAVFHLEIEGNANTGIWTPVLKVYYAYSSKPLNAKAVSILVDGVRYDYAASSQVIQQNKKKTELITAPLTLEGVKALEALLEGEEIAVRLLGDSRYTAALEKDSSTSRKQLEAASLDGLAGAFAMLEEAGYAAYQLWDLSAAAWESKHGFAPAFAMAAVEKTLGDYEISDSFGMILPQDRSDAAQYVQQALIDAGFLSGSVGRTFTDGASSAAARAQRYLGLIETGCADATLLKALEEGIAPEVHAEEELIPLADTVALSLSRYWFAKGVCSTFGEGQMRLSTNGDHVLIVADGFVRNLSQDELRLFMQANAQVIYQGKYAYDATVLCERDQGRDLDMALLPLAQARLLVYAEIPAYLADDSQADWTLQLTVKGETLEYELQ